MFSPSITDSSRARKAQRRSRRQVISDGFATHILQSPDTPKVKKNKTPFKSTELNAQLANKENAINGGSAAAPKGKANKKLNNDSISNKKNNNNNNTTTTTIPSLLQRSQKAFRTALLPVSSTVLVPPHPQDSITNDKATFARIARRADRRARAQIIHDGFSTVVIQSPDTPADTIKQQQLKQERLMKVKS